MTIAPLPKNGTVAAEGPLPLFPPLPESEPYPSEPVPSVRKAQKRKAQTLLPVPGWFHLLGEGPALIGMLAVL